MPTAAAAGLLGILLLASCTQARSLALPAGAPTLREARAWLASQNPACRGSRVGIEEVWSEGVIFWTDCPVFDQRVDFICLPGDDGAPWECTGFYGMGPGSGADEIPAPPRQPPSPTGRA